MRGDLTRVADVIGPSLDFDPSTLEHDTVAYRTFTGPPIEASAANTPGWRAADLGAANGHGNARSVGQILALISRGGAGDHGRLLTPGTIDLVFDQQSNGTDLVNGLHRM